MPNDFTKQNNQTLEPKLSIKINNKQPVELIDLTESLLSLADEYKRFVAANPDLHPADFKLYVKEISSGSIKADIIALVTTGATLLLPYKENLKSLVEFAKYLKSTYQYFIGKEEEKPQLQKADLNNLSTFIEPIAKDNGSQLNITATDGGNVSITFNINSQEANAAQNTIRRELEQFKEPEKRFYEKVVLYWHQASKDVTKQTGDRGIIESIASNPVKVIFDNEKTKALMILQSGENPFMSAYIVDVFVETINGKPALYKIISVYERLETLE